MATVSELSFFQSLAIQGRVLHALMMRELITRFGRDNLGVLWLVGEPMIFTLGVATLWSAAGLAHGGTGIPIVAFAVTGYSSVLMWRNATTQCSAGIEQNKPLLFHRSVLIIDVFLTRIALEIIGASSSFIVLSLFFIFIGWMPVPDDLLVKAASGRGSMLAHGSRRRTAAPRLFRQCRSDALRHRLYGRVLFATDTVRLVCRA
jgi:ABC-type polysaccharide/polyol phosphate export permease